MPFNNLMSAEHVLRVTFGDTMTLLDAVSSPVTGQAITVRSAEKTFQATVSGTGAVTADIELEASNDGINWLPEATFNLSGTTSVSDGLSVDESWKFHRARLTNITGTAAVVTVIVGI